MSISIGPLAVRVLACRPWTLLLIAFAAGCASGCRFFFAAQEIKQLEAISSVTGTVTSPYRDSEPIVVGIFRTNGKEPVLRSYSVLLQAGAYKVRLAPGQYEIWAFEDRDQDFVLDEGEPVGAPNGGAPLVVESGQDITADILLEKGTPRPDWLRVDLSSSESSEDLDSAISTIGEVVSLSDRRFSAKRGTYGSWRPVSTIVKGGLGVFFTRPYDPCRTPVLFVQGMSGSPREFKTMAAALNPARFQAWFFTYPASLRLGLLSDYLANAIRTLGVRHKPDRLIVVAHSMGGLVARDFINDNAAEEKKDLITTFISISTPWNGARSAETGIDFSPVVIPSWIDMVPNSAFIAALYRSPLPSYVRHHLWFGFVEGDAGDEAVTTASMLDPRAQDGAIEIRGFAANHRDILRHPPLVDRFRSVVEAALADTPANARCEDRG